MIRSITVTRSAAIMFVALAVVACVGSVATPATSVGPTATGAVATPVAVETSAATSPPDPTMTPDAPAPSLGEPPAATLAAEGGDAVAGSLGSFVWGDGGSDSPWLPGAPISVGAGETLTVSVGGLPVQDWTAKRIAAGVSDGVGAVRLGSGAAAPITFPAPKPGRWSVQLAVTFAGDLGSATYYWEVTVR